MMPWVIRHKIDKTYVGKNRQLVEINYAKVFPTEQGANRAMRNYCRYSVSRLIDQNKLSLLEIVPVKVNEV